MNIFRSLKTVARVPTVQIPHHIAIVMDGNGRWANKRFLPRVAGHRQGVESLRRCVRACADRGVKVLTVFAFSSENWSRPNEEVSGLLELLAGALAREVQPLNDSGVRICFIGDRSRMSDKVRGGFAHAFNGSAQQASEFVKLGFCLGFGGTATFRQAQRVRALLRDVPIENIVVETDAPDIPPSFLGTMGSDARNSPVYLPQIGETLAEVRGIPVAAFAAATTANVRRVLALR